MDKFNRDELQPPSWIDVHFFEEVLKNCESCKDVKINDFTINPATQKGDHFASIMFRAEVKYLKNSKENEISLIIKTMPVEDGMKKDMFKETNIFETEIAMYSEVIPRFHSILRQIGDETILGARLLYSSLTPHKVIVFEDLKKKGYKMFHKRQANFEEIKFILEKICRWHAISFKLINEGDTSLNKFTEGVFTLSAEALKGFFEDGLNNFENLLSSLPDGDIYIEKFKKIKSNILQRVIDIYRNTGDFCVLNHGDFHLNNMMFKFDNNTDKLEDVMLVDFQFPILAPVAIDLIYLIYINGDSDCRSRRDEVIYTYYTKFVEALNSIGFTGKVPSLTDLHIHLMKYKSLETYFLAAMFPLAVGIYQTEIDPEKMLESNDQRGIFYKLSSVLEEIKKCLPVLLHKGYFDE